MHKPLSTVCNPTKAAEGIILMQHMMVDTHANQAYMHAGMYTHMHMVFWYLHAVLKPVFDDRGLASISLPQHS